VRVEVFLEELSAEAALRNLLPGLLGSAWTCRFHVFDGKHDLLEELPSRLRGLARRLPPTSRILVLVDEDREDCVAIKSALEDAAEQAGLSTKSGVGEGPFQVVNRVAVEELEAWFLGDTQALLAAYPEVPPDLGSRRPYGDPDAVTGGTSEALERVLQRAGYYAAGMPKIEVARNISSHMDPLRNSSHSFQVFVSGVQAIAESV
jgi:hypothetical protein